MSSAIEEAQTALLEKRKALGLDKRPLPKPLVNSLSGFRYEVDPVREAALEAERVFHEKRIQDNEAQAKENKKAGLWRNSGVPARHRDFLLPEGDSDWLNAFHRLEAGLGSGFLFVAMGTRGTGKTQLGTCLVRSACNAFKSAQYVKALDIFIALRESYRKDGPSESSVVEQFIKPDLLVIDAMEERGETPFENRLLNHIIDRRYDNLDDTLLITNQAIDAFADSVGPSIVSRIHETGDKIVCDWNSFRSKPK
jgi:DNA replication protein DnaC